MKDTKILNVLHRANLWTTSWVLLIAAALVALAVYTLSSPVLQGGLVGWLFPVCISLMPGAAVVLVVLMTRQFRNVEVPDTAAVATPPPPDTAPLAAAKPPVPYSLDHALGVPQLRELRAHVDLLCTMATLERMGPDLTEGLKQWGIPARAQQAAISAEILQRLLSAPGLESVLQRCAVPPGTRAFHHVQTDLQAIAASLHLLGQQVQGELPPPALVKSEIEAGEAMMGTMPLVDRLLVQYSQLLTGVASMARILATSYEHMREGRTAWISERKRTAEPRTAEGPSLADALNLPRWKLN